MYRLKSLFSSWRRYVVLIGLIASLWTAHVYLPVQHNPFKPLSLADPIGLATYGKFTTLKYKPATCFAALDDSEVPYVNLVDEKTGTRCGFENAVAVQRLQTPLNDRLPMTCHLVAALYSWEHNAARPLATKILGSPLARIETFGTYSCRNISGSGQRSEHATANAIDISGFRLADGRLISVLKNWGEDSPEGHYLRRLHDEACRLFSVTLGPDYNAAHADHFHLDFGSGDSCR